MADDAGVAGGLISLPQGGGALRGIGESFRADPQSGTARVSLPIAAPRGRDDLTPQLGLEYSSGYGNGPFGLGWRLSLPGVSRKTSQGIPRYEDAAGGAPDTFVLTGTEDLVQISEATGGGVTVRSYRPRTEGLFARVRHVVGPGDDHWEVASRTGVVSRYGASAQSRVFDADDQRRVFAWLIESTTDTFGNRVAYSYKRDTAYNQVYLTSVKWVDYRPAGAAADEFLYSVEFDYGEYDENGEPGGEWAYRGDDTFSSYRSGFEIRTARRCRRIFVRLAEQDGLIRSYELGYTAAGHNRVSLLTSFVLAGYQPREAGDVTGASLPDGSEVGEHYRVSAYPPLEFGYSDFQPESRRYRALTGPNGELPPEGLSAPGYEVLDLDGNGRPGILQPSGPAQVYWRNLGDGRLARPRPLREVPAGVTPAGTDTKLADMNGDGRTDLLVLREQFAGYFPTSFEGGWDERSFKPFQTTPAVDLADPSVHLMDLNGDGVVDILQATAPHFILFLNDRTGGWRVEHVPRRALEGFPNVGFDDPGRLRVAELAGEGLLDFVLVGNGRVDYWPHCGYGRYAKRITMRNTPRFGASFDPRRLVFADVDGDGYADLVYVDGDQTVVCVNRAGNAWSDPIVIPGTPLLSEPDSVEAVDVLGSGTTCLVWSSPRRSAAVAERNYQFLDLTGGEKPYLLREIRNNLGARTTLEYRPSTWFQQRDEERGSPWLTKLPFPVQCLSAVEVDDEISGAHARTDYTYRHGHWDPHEREFCGFGRVDQLDAESFAGQDDAPPLETRTWFDVGPVNHGDRLDCRTEYWDGDPPVLAEPAPTTALLDSLNSEQRRLALRALRGNTLRTELYGRDGDAREDLPYTVSETSFGIRQEPGGYLAFQHASRETDWERGGDPLTRITIWDDFDAFGQARQQTVADPPRRSRRRSSVTGAVVGQVAVDETRVLSTHVRTEYAAPDTGLYLHNRLAQTRTLELASPPALVETQPADPKAVTADQAGAAFQLHALYRSKLDAWSTGAPLPAEVRLLGHEIRHYDGAAYAGRPAGEVGPHGSLSRVERLAFTAAGLGGAYGSRLPTYLGGLQALPANAPTGFGSAIGYRRVPDSADGHHAGLYFDSERRRFDFQQTGVPGRGLVTGTRDEMGGETAIEQDAYRLLAAKVTDPVGLETTAGYDYRTGRPTTVVDPNGITRSFRFAPHGLVSCTFVQGRSGEGGSEDKPDFQFRYDLWAYASTASSGNPQPIYAHGVQRVWDADGPDETLEFREYTDGFGRLVQKRSQAETEVFGALGDDVGLPRDFASTLGAAQASTDPDRVVVSGWQVYGNKGQLVERYEPFFADGFDFQPEADAKLGLPTRFTNDARGRRMRQVNGDGSEEQTLYGGLPDPADFSTLEPSPWVTTAYDANDLASLSTAPEGSSLTARAPAAHRFTPAEVRVNARREPICTLKRDGTVLHVTRLRRDGLGNEVEVTDELGRSAMRRAFDLRGQLVRVQSIDNGLRTMILDAQGNAVESRDGKGALVLREYDSLARLKRLWARDATGRPLTLRELVAYGDEGNRTAAAQASSLGQRVAHWDEAGLLELTDRDFRGRPTRKVRTVISDQAIAGGWEPDWSAAGAQNALGVTYETKLEHDAAGRVVRLECPAAPDGHITVLTPHYNRAGLLERVEADGVIEVRKIAYNPRGQRVLVLYGNGTMQRRAYEPGSARLRRLRSERYSMASGGTVLTGTGGAPLQDCVYELDLVGNVTAIEERTPGCGIRGTPDADRLVRSFEYDPLYRLTSASGRICKAQGCGTPGSAYTPGVAFSTQANAPDLTEAYTETYEHDPGGNLLSIARSAATAPTRRHFGMGGLTPGQWASAPSNRLTSVVQGATTATLVYDGAGNLVAENVARTMRWDHADRMVGFTVRPPGAAQSSVDARYLYGADGARVKKWVRRGAAQVDTTVYIDAVFEHFREQRAAGSLANAWVRLSDGDSLLCRLRRGPPATGDRGPPAQYELTDHLGSSQVVLDPTGSWVSREEQTPFGETSFGGFARKRYRYSGRERDEESGYYWYGSRYYLPLTGRWTSPDPAGSLEGTNLYRFVLGNPITLIDAGGHGAPNLVPVGEAVNESSELVRLLRAGQAANQLTGAEAGGWAVGEVGGLELLAGAHLGLTGLALAGLMVWADQSVQADLKAQEDEMNSHAHPFVEPQPGDVTGRVYASAQSDGLRRAFMEHALETILDGCQGAPHPLEFLVDKDAKDWKSRVKNDPHDPAVQAGHLTSESFRQKLLESNDATGGKIADLADRLALELLALEDADWNQHASNKGETQGGGFFKDAIDICGVPVEKRTAQTWEDAGLLPKGTVENAKPSTGWTRPPPKPPPQPDPGKAAKAPKVKN